MLNRRFLLECFERKDMEAGVPCLSCSYPVDFSLGSLGFTFFFFFLGKSSFGIYEFSISALF